MGGEGPNLFLELKLQPWEVFKRCGGKRKPSNVDLASAISGAARRPEPEPALRAAPGSSGTFIIACNSSCAIFSTPVAFRTLDKETDVRLQWLIHVD
jgi:hypothetical protein